MTRYILISYKSGFIIRCFQDMDLKLYDIKYKYTFKIDEN
jgi:hypothetical protein